MSLKICLGAYTLRYIKGGAYMWAFLNWALGLRAIGCQVIWLDSVTTGTPRQEIEDRVRQLKDRLLPFGLAQCISVIEQNGNPINLPEYLSFDEAAEADIFFNLGYDLTDKVVSRFRRSVFVDIDPGLTQIWLSLKQMKLAQHDVYLTYGETVGRSDSKIPDCGRQWQYVPPPVFLPAWPVTQTSGLEPFTTVSNWWGNSDWIELGETLIDNSKRAAFLEYAELPRHTTAKLEIAIPLLESEDVTGDRRYLEQLGWSIRHVFEVSISPQTHQAYVQQSRGEFSCMKRAYALLETAWISERTINYLASGKPALVQFTGSSNFLPDCEGLLRFRNFSEAVQYLALLEKNYDSHSRAARQLAEEFFEAKKVIQRAIELSVS
jgi:hypothetical protein